MNEQKKMELLVDLFEVEKEELSADKSLYDFESWDSMTKLSLIIMFDDELGKKITAEDIMKLSTIKDILDLMD